MASIPPLPRFGTTSLGSVPYAHAEPIARWLAESLDVPAWPQLPRRSFRESMYVQFASALPGIVIDEVKSKIFFDTSGDLLSAVEIFYEKYIAESILPSDAFALPVENAEGFNVMLDVLASCPGVWCKGQVTGPVSFGLTVTDQDRRASLYHELLNDPIVKNIASNARWQIRMLQSVRPNVILFIDEPYLASFGSAYVSLSREGVIAMLDEVVDAVHAEGALAGVHCCGNTDWSVLLATHVDILNLDAYGYVHNLALYPAELRQFLDRGGMVAWGIVPNNDEIYSVTPTGLADRLQEGFNQISCRARQRGFQIEVEELSTRSLIAPSCGLGSTTIDIAQRVTETLVRVGEILKG